MGHWVWEVTKAAVKMHIATPSVEDWLLAYQAPRAQRYTFGTTLLFAYARAILPTGRVIFGAWTLVEFWWYFFYLYRKRVLSARRAFSPAMVLRTCTERHQTLMRSLEALEDIHSVQNQKELSLHGVTSVADFLTMQSTPTSSGSGMTNGLGKMINASFGSLGQLHQMVAEREPEAKEKPRLSPALFDSGGGKKGGGIKRNESFCVEDLVQKWDAERDEARKLRRQISSSSSSGKELVEPSPRQQDVDLLDLKRLEISSWFIYKRGGMCVNAKEVHQLDFEQFVAHFFFEARAPEELGQEEQRHLKDMVAGIVAWADLPEPQPGHNPRLSLHRLLRDPLRCRHRPLIFYGISTALLPLAEDILMSFLGFSQFSSGSMYYWHRPRPKGPQHPRSGNSRPTNCPIVVLHGLGLGVPMYAPLIAAFADEEEEIFVVTAPHIAMRPVSRVPSQREFVSAVTDMLAVWGHGRAHFVGHSFGTAAVAWILRHARDCVQCISFLDPICFLTSKMISTIQSGFYFAQSHKMDVINTVINYFAFEELHICHTLCRQVDWQATTIWPEDLRDTPCFISLDSKDSIVPSHSIHRLVQAEKMKRGDRSDFAPFEVMWAKDYPHGGFLLSSRLRGETMKAIFEIHKKSQVWWEQQRSKTLAVATAQAYKDGRPVSDAAGTLGKIRSRSGLASSWGVS
eukprot:gnl/TRDRNA2_/TRDRNA2_141732_c0_seq3.p1 gnl/TRDRNA2_/TRDRNA2_141732_c0~~gnl/TRDRNA2_/TRDRNA2_141732_c0_seq3.p1  ORF type:complete len:757 (-),score=115.10 gnl/TRDRNA2_/TRDRNA2_141732_c0_seq3:60-2111(-)